jgi:ADP-heptose:LPS heptosyltransferase
MHMAAAVGTPVIALFGPQDPRIFGPLGDGHCVVYEKAECSPCRQDVCAKENGERCMELIAVEKVIACIDDFMNRREASHENPGL